MTRMYKKYEVEIKNENASATMTAGKSKVCIGLQHENYYLMGG